MKRILFATTAAAAMAATTAAADVTVFGDARIGLGYNALGNGQLILNDTTDANADRFNDVSAVSRVRFGVRMTGETPTGITFGATIRADNSGDGPNEGGNSLGGLNGTDGNVFISGIYGTLTYGDIASAHQQHVGDLPEIGLTALGFQNEFLWLGNRQGRGERPTVRYDFDVAGFGVSVGSNNALNDIGVGASFSGDFAGGTFSIGGGYYDTPDDNEWTAGLTAGFAGFTGQVVYINRDSGYEEIAGSLGTDFAGIGFAVNYREILSDADFAQGGVLLSDGDNSYGAGLTFDLGGGASLRGGVLRTFNGETAGDLGISMAF